MLEIGELSCVKCHNLFNSTERVPRLLPECGHTLCSACIAGLLKGAHGGVFECPEDKYQLVFDLKCRTSCGMGKKQAEDFPKNQSLLQLLAKQAHAEKEREKEKENMGKSKAGRESKGEAECGQHKRKFEIVCVDCKMRLCSKCALFGGHRNHDIRAEEDVLTELTMRGDCLNEMVQLVKDNEQIFAKQDEVKQAYEKCTAREKEIHTLIELKFQDYIEALNNKKARAIQSLANIALAVGDKFTSVKEAPQNLAERVAKWKAA